MESDLPALIPSPTTIHTYPQSSKLKQHEHAIINEYEQGLANMSCDSNGRNCYYEVYTAPFLHGFVHPWDHPSAEPHGSSTPRVVSARNPQWAMNLLLAWKSGISSQPPATHNTHQRIATGRSFGLGAERRRVWTIEFISKGLSWAVKHGRRVSGTG